MRCKFDNSQPCGMKEYLGVCACDMCKENPTKIHKPKEKKMLKTEKFEINCFNAGEDRGRKCYNSHTCNHEFKQLEGGRCIKFSECPDFDEVFERCNFTGDICGLRDLTGGKACNRCEHNPTKFNSTVRSTHKEKEEKNGVVKKNLESLEKQQKKKAKQQLKKEEREIKRKEEKKSRELYLNVAEDFKESVIVPVESKSQINIKNTDIVEVVQVEAVKIEQSLAVNKIVVKKKPGILSKLKKWLFR